MISLLLDDIPFEQDIRELFMAFYPGETYTYEPDFFAMITLDAIRDDSKCQLVISSSDGRQSFAETIMTDDRKETKNNIKRALYALLTSWTGKSLPWGCHTGIRPTKAILDELLQGTDPDRIRYNMIIWDKVSEKKADLAIDIATRERSVLDKFDYKDGYSLYIGIPFCPTTCAYCSFTSYPISRWKDKIKDYLDALDKEMKKVSDMMKDKKLQTIYIGGGTPTSLTADMIDRLICSIEDIFDLSYIREFTVESGRADSINREKLQVLKNHHIDRISINPQTLNQKTLDLIGRHHTVEEFIDCFDMARDMGFDNINTDIILGLPGEDERDLEVTLDGIRRLKPDDLTVHAMAIKRAARIHTDNIDSTDNIYIENESRITDEIVDKTYNCAIDMGLVPYYMYRQKNMAGNFENVGYCKSKKEGLYNILMMEERHPIIGCGAGASSKIVHMDTSLVERIANVKDPALYIERIDDIISKKKI